MADTTTRLTNSTRELLTPLRESILNKPHYISGKLELPASSFTLFYKPTKDGSAARFEVLGTLRAALTRDRHIDLANATSDDLRQLAQACQPASFGMVQEGVTNESCNVGTMDLECFASRLALDQTGLTKLIMDYIFEGDQSRKIKMELHELNVYTQGSSSKPRVVTPRGKNMFGSLVIVFPTPHEGGALLVRHRGKEWSFDPWEMTTTRTPTRAIGYAVLLNDVEHGVTPVTSGHRVTLTYGLYRGADGSASAQDSAEPLSLLAHERTFRESFEALLANPEFLPYGGALGFGLRHSYPVVEDQISHLYGLLKANDAVVYRSLRALGFQPALYFYHESSLYMDSWDTIEGGLIDHVLEFEGFDEDAREGVDVAREILDNGGHVVYYDDSHRSQVYAYEKAETMVWATPMTSFDTQKAVYTFYGNEPSAEIAYWDLCLVVRIGKAGERLMYPTLSQLKKVLRRDDRHSLFWERNRR